MKTELLNNETLVKKGVANMMRGAEAVGGKLFLTDHRLIFESHALNIQTGTTIVALDEIADTQLCWTKVFSLIPLVPNSIAVLTTEGVEYRMVVFGRKSWKTVIDDQRQRQTELR